jgi:hypothetical protein
MILVDEWSWSGGYVRSILFEPIKVAGLNIAPIEMLIFLAVLPILGRIFEMLIVKSGAAHPAVAILAVVAFGTGILKGYLRLGSFAGLAEIKCFFFLCIFISLSRRAIARGVFARFVPLLSWACILHCVIDLGRFLIHPIVDANLGQKTEVNIIPCILLPVFVARALSQGERFQRTYLVSIAIVVVDLYLSQGRGVLFEVILGVLLTVAFCKVRRTRPRIRLGKFIPAAGLIVLLLLVVVGIGLSSSEFIRSFAFWQDQADQGHNASNLGHYYDVLRGVQMISDSPITGMGFGGKLPALGTATFEIVHNEFLHFWILFGIGGAFLWMYMFFILPIQFVRELDSARRKGYEIRDEHYLIFSMIGSTIGHFVALPSFHLFLPQTWLIGLYLAILTSIPATRKLMTARLYSHRQAFPSFGIQPSAAIARRP